MTKLLEFKDKLIKFYGQYETYVFPIIKFVLAFVLFAIIGANIGYMKFISSVPVSLILALVCCLLPANFMIFFAGIVILLDMYVLAVEAAVVTLVLFLIIYFLYFRFAPQEGIAVVLTPICFKINIPYIMPVGCGLLRQPTSILSVVCATVVYYYLNGIKKNEAAFTAVLTEDGNTEVSSKFSVAIGQLTNNTEMFLVVGVFLVTCLIVYLVRRLAVDYAWTIALVSGTLVQICALVAGYLVMDISGKTVGVIAGGIISMLIAFAIQFFCMNLDYARTERVQFEDDEYYYYVKAVPKKLVASEEKTVKRFGNTASMGKRIEQSRREVSPEEEELSRRVIAKELDIDEDMLK